MVVIVDGAELFYETRGTGCPCIVPSILGTTVFERPRFVKPTFPWSKTR